MRKSFVGSLAVLSLLLGGSIVASGQMVRVGCARKIIESYPDEQSRPVLQFLDQARPVADEFMEAFSQQTGPELSKRFPDIEIWFNQEPNGGKQVDQTQLLRAIGAPASYEYRDQEVLYNLTHPEIDPKGATSTAYLMWTDKLGREPLYVLVETHQTSLVSTRITAALFFGKWAASRFSDHDPAKGNSMKCVGMEKDLRVKGY